jgi:hypothetical protein
MPRVLETTLAELGVDAKLYHIRCVRAQSAFFLLIHLMGKIGKKLKM